MNWNDYRHKNETEGDCQLITAVNAYAFLYDECVCCDYYEHLIELCGCRYGAAIAIKKAWAELGIEPYSPCMHLDNPDLPFEITTSTKHYGQHSCLAVDFNQDVEAYRITNFKRMTSASGWIFDEDLHYLSGFGWIEDGLGSSIVIDSQYRYRSFRKV